MAEVHWKCPVCAFEAHNEEEKMKHMEETKNEPAHKKAHEEMRDGERFP